MEEIYNKHYISIREDGAIIDAWSDGPHPEKDIANAICINEKGSYQFRLNHDGEENPPMYEIGHIPLYKWDGSAIIRRTDNELHAERSTIANF